MPPSYNHTRGDSPLTPCPKCAGEIQRESWQRYIVECEADGETFVWWFDSDLQYDTQTLAVNFIANMRQRFGRSVQLHHVARQPITTPGENAPQADPGKRIVVFSQNDCPILPEGPPPKQLRARR